MILYIQMIVKFVFIKNSFKSLVKKKITKHIVKNIHTPPFKSVGSEPFFFINIKNGCAG